MATNEDPISPWITESTNTIGVESINAFDKATFGWGKIGTGKMTETAELRKLHPAAAYCYEMGSEWYLPSIAELRLIWVNRGLLGSSYTFGPTYYWSATEYSSTYIVGYWGLLFNEGTTAGYDKNSIYCQYEVRCIMEL